MKNTKMRIYDVSILLLLLLIIIININTNSFDVIERTSYKNSDIAYELLSSEENISYFIDNNNKEYVLLAFDSFNNSQRIYRNLHNDIHEVNIFDSFMNLFVNELKTNFNNDDLDYWSNLLKDINTFNNFFLGNDIGLVDENVQLEKASNLLKSEYIDNFITINPSEIN